MNLNRRASPKFQNVIMNEVFIQWHSILAIIRMLTMSSLTWFDSWDRRHTKRRRRRGRGILNAMRSAAYWITTTVPSIFMGKLTWENIDVHKIWSRSRPLWVTCHTLSLLEMIPRILKIAWHRSLYRVRSLRQRPTWPLRTTERSKRRQYPAVKALSISYVFLLRTKEIG